MNAAWNEPSMLDVRKDTGKPFCQCCLSEIDIVQVGAGLGNFTMYLCPECKDAVYKHAQRRGEWPFNNAIVAWLECPTHGKQVPRDVVEESIQFIGGGNYPVKGRSGANLWGVVDYQEAH